MDVLKKEIQEIRQAKLDREKELTLHKVQFMIKEHSKKIEAGLEKDFSSLAKKLGISLDQEKDL